MKGPSIAVMLGGKPEGDEEEGGGGDVSLSEAKMHAEHAAIALAEAVSARDGKRICKAFMALDQLCDHIHELEESGEEEEAEHEPGGEEEHGEEAAEE